MYWLVIGTDGFIGEALAIYLENKDKNVIRTTRRFKDGLYNKDKKLIYLDLNDLNSKFNFDNISIAYICAGVSSIEDCRKDPIGSRNVNVDGTFELAKILIENGIFVIILSTNMVFDGSIPYRRIDEDVCPVTEYGRQKADLENKLMNLGRYKYNKLFSIVRITKIIGRDMPLFKNWIKDLNNKNVIYPFSNVVISPVSLPYVVNLLYQIGEKRLSGIVQVSGRYDVSYEKIAYYIARNINKDNRDLVNLIQPIKSKKEHIDKYTTLDTEKLENELGIRSPDVLETINYLIRR